MWFDWMFATVLPTITGWPNSSNVCISSLITFLMKGSRLIVKGRKIFRSATVRFFLWSCRKTSSFFSSLEC